MLVYSTSPVSSPLRNASIALMQSRPQVRSCLSGATVPPSRPFVIWRAAGAEDVVADLRLAYQLVSFLRAARLGRCREATSTTRALAGVGTE